MELSKKHCPPQLSECLFGISLTRTIHCSHLLGHLVCLLFQLHPNQQNSVISFLPFFECKVTDYWLKRLIFVLLFSMLLWHRVPYSNANRPDLNRKDEEADASAADESHLSVRLCFASIGSKCLL